MLRDDYGTISNLVELRPAEIDTNHNRLAKSLSVAPSMIAAIKDAEHKTTIPIKRIPEFAEVLEVPANELFQMWLAEKLGDEVFDQFKAGGVLKDVC